MRYKDIPPTGKMTEYFKDFITKNNKISNLTPNIENRGDSTDIKDPYNKKNNFKINKNYEKFFKNKKILSSHGFEILSKSFSNENKDLHDNQNKLKNKLSYKLFTHNNNFNNSIDTPDLNSEIFSNDENINLNKTNNSGISNNSEYSFDIDNKKINFNMPKESYKLDNKFSTEYEENKFYLKNKKLLNSKEIKEKIKNSDVVRDFEKFKTIFKINDNNIPESRNINNTIVLKLLRNSNIFF